MRMLEEDKKYIEEMCKSFVTHKRLPYCMSVLYEKYKNSDELEVSPVRSTMIGSGIGSLLTYTAMVSITRMNLKMGRSLFIGTIGATFGAMLGRCYASKRNAKNIENFMRTQPHTYEDNITFGNYRIYSHFNYYKGYTNINGNTHINKDGLLIFDGSMYCYMDVCEFNSFH